MCVGPQNSSYVYFERHTLETKIWLALLTKIFLANLVPDKLGYDMNSPNQKASPVHADWALQAVLGLNILKGKQIFPLLPIVAFG